MNETTLRYSEPLLREAVRTFVFRSLRRSLGLWFFVAWAGLLAFLAYLLVQGDRSWTVGVLATTLVIAAAFCFVVYRAHFQNTIGRFREMKLPEATLSCDEEQFTVKSELGTATFPWSTITEVWRYPRFWLILYSRSQFSTLPLDCLDPETQAFITRKTQRIEPNH